MHKLQDKWIIWGHELPNKMGEDDWSMESYKKIYEFSTIEGFWKFFNNIKHFNNFMLFIMRDDILPIYEDNNCIDGGFFSYVVSMKKFELNKSILTLLTRMIGCTLTDLENYEEICGMSVSPKGSRAVIKIWIKDNVKKDMKIYLPDPNFKKYRYKSHKN